MPIPVASQVGAEKGPGVETGPGAAITDMSFWASSRCLTMIQKYRRVVPRNRTRYINDLVVTRYRHREAAALISLARPVRKSKVASVILS